MVTVPTCSELEIAVSQRNKPGLCSCDVMGLLLRMAFNVLLRVLGDEMPAKPDVGPQAILGASKDCGVILWTRMSALAK